MNKKIYLFVMCSLLIFGLVACGENKNTDNADETSGIEQIEQEGEGDKGKKAMRIVTDHTGQKVEVPEKIDRIVISGILPLPSVYCYFRGSADGLVGMHPSSMAAAKESFLVKAYPELLDVDTSFVTNGKINVEELLELKPDIVFCGATNKEELEIYKNAGIKAVGFSTTLSDFNCIETHADWIDLLGQIFGDSKRANELIAYGRQVEEEILSKTKSLTDDKRPKAMVLFNYANGKIKTSGSNFFGQYWIDTSGGQNVARDLEGIAEINMEQIYKWNPEYIFITNFSPYLPEDLYNNAIEGHDWSKVKAVMDKKVYKFPLGMYRWYPPASDTPLCLKWLATKLQPNLFKDMDMDEEIKTFYKKFYNMDLSQEDLEKIYNPSREASGISLK